MHEEEAMQILSDYVKGCGGVLCTGWHARLRWKMNHGRPRMFLISMPPQDFRPVGGQQRQKEYTSLRQVALAMGLQPDEMIAAGLVKAVRNEKNSTSIGQDPQNTNACRKRDTNPSVGLLSDSEAASGPSKVFKQGACAFPAPAARTYKADPPMGHSAVPIHELDRGGPVRVPHKQPSMLSSRSSSSLEVQPNMAEHVLADQRNVAVSGQPSPAAKPGTPGSWQPNSPRSSGLQQRPGGQHCDKETERLQLEIRELKQQNATLELKMKRQESEQRAKQGETHAQQLALTQTVNHLFSELRAREEVVRNESQVKQDAISIDSD